MRFKTLLILTLTYLLVAPVVFLAEVKIFGATPVITARGIIGIYTLFYALTLGETALIGLIRRKKPASLPGAYVAAKGVRFLITVFLLVCYGILQGPELVTFTINVFICFIVTLVLTTVIYMKEECKNNPLSE